MTHIAFWRKLILVCCVINMCDAVVDAKDSTADYQVPVSDQPDAETYRQIESQYSSLLKVLVPEGHALKSLYEQPLQREKIMLEEGLCLDCTDGKMWLACLYQPLTLTFCHSPLKLRSVNNYALEEYLKEHKEQRQKVPALTPDKAMSKGLEYLKEIGFALPPNYRLERMDFDVSNRSMWTIRWQRYAGEYPYDTTNQTLTNYATISFHETLGIGTCSVQAYLPEPSSLDVKVNRQDAVLKASKVIPLIEATPYYLQGRVPGFVFKSLQDASLRIVAPNWLLDPERTIWIFDHIPKEVRLCWVVRFATVNSKSEPSPEYHFIPPDIIVYIDASTGEVVGGTFT